MPSKGATTGTALAWPWRWQVYCPNPMCDRLTEIPDDAGKRTWERIPDRVTCPTCGKSFRVRPAIGTRERRTVKAKVVVSNGESDV